jgi:glycosyltransferase involved in cell wall biosynthesis
VEKIVDWRTKRTDFGREVLGPIFFDYFHRLHTHFLSYDNRPTSFLFCSRAGLRLKYLYELFVRSQGSLLPNNQLKLFWTSRYMTAKGLSRRNPQVSWQLIAKEFAHTCVREMLPCLLSKGLMSEISDDYFDSFNSILDDTPTENILQQIFSDNNEFSDSLRKHYEEQSDLFERQLKNLTQGKEVAVLIDSGWQGTTQRLLMEGYPEIDWHGLYFARIGNLTANNWHFFNVIGLMFESYGYDDKQIESCIHYHYHLIEDLLEPNIPSVEYLYQEEKSGEILPPEICHRSDYLTPREDEEHYCGVIEYLQVCQQRQSLLEIRSHSHEAWQILHRQICFPTPADANILDVRPRSPNFAKNETNRVITRSNYHNNHRTKEGRLQHCLWKQGQIALEYRETYYREQLKYAEEQELASKKTKKICKSEILADVPKVAIITRTKNRPLMLKRAAQSVADQNFTDYFWVVVNDGGEPNEVVRIIAQSLVDLRKVIIIHNPVSLGMEAASNRAIATSMSKYIVIHDDDDTWQPQFLAKTVEFLENPPVPSMRGVITHATRWSEVIIDNDYTELVESMGYNDWVISVPLYEMASANMFAPIQFVFLRDVYEEIGGFDETLPVLGDWDFNLRFLMKHDIGVLPEKLANYHHRDYQKSGDYSNSLYGEISKHQNYDAIVRNRSLRNMADNLPLMSIISLGRATHEIRGMLQQLLNR